MCPNKSLLCNLHHPTPSLPPKQGCCSNLSFWRLRDFLRHLIIGQTFVGGVLFCLGLFLLFHKKHFFRQQGWSLRGLCKDFCQSVFSHFYAPGRKLPQTVGGKWFDHCASPEEPHLTQWLFSFCSPPTTSLFLAIK